MRILVVKTSSMGDLVHTLPAITDATRAYPNLVVDWVCEPAFAEVPHWHPSVRDVLQIPLRRWKGRLFKLWFSKEFTGYKAALSALPYDAVIDAQGLLKSAWLLTRFAEGPTHGYDRRSAREGLASFAYQHRHAVSRAHHAVTRTRQLFAKALAYSVPDTLPDASIDLGCSTAMADRLVLLPGTSRPAKQWSVTGWADVARWGLDHYAEVVIAVGTSAEQQVLSAHCSEPRVHWKVAASLTQVATCLAGARAVVAVDTGLAHVADALGVPLLALFGPTDPARVGPVQPRSQCMVAPDGRMESIKAEAVMDWLQSQGNVSAD